ncbi:MAG TPA: adenylate/guanylate cyclase domain-containing protein [Solirubrobacteraceae bacterium]|nr:adenylate/guanylate cyclase domain-containing protein [Solirubrobacteraceae bacterium]
MQAKMQMSSIDVIASALEPVTPTLGRMSSPDGAVTLMLSDIADAPAAAEELGADRWEQLIRDHHLLVEQLVARHDGEVTKWQGDGFLASFRSAHSGLHAAVDLQRTFTAGPSPVAIRVGLHSGFVMGNPEQMMGRNVVLAARIAGQAKGGEILVSSTAKEYTETDPSFRFEPHGEYFFKGLHGEHEVFAVMWR